MPIQKLTHKLSKLTSDDLMFYSVALTFFLLPTGTAPPIISTGIACLIWVASGKILQVKSIIKQPWFYPVIPFLILPWIGLLHSQNLELGMDYAMKTKYWVILFITAGLTLNQKHFDIIIKCFWAGLFVGAFLALLQFVGIIGPIHDARYMGFGVVYTLINMYLIIGILITSFYFKKAKSFSLKGILLFLIFSFIFHITVLRGRSGYLIFVMVCPLVVNNLLSEFSYKIKIGGVIFLASALLLSPVVRERINLTVIELQEEKETILEGGNSERFPRFFLVQESIKIILAHPIVGIGTGSFVESTKKKNHKVSHPHNNLLHMGTSFGILGIIACFWLFGRMFRDAWRHRDTAMGYLVFSSCIVLFLGGMLDTQILNTGTLLFLSLMYGFLNHLKPIVIDDEEITKDINV